MYCDGDRTIERVGEKTAGGAYATYAVLANDGRETATIDFQYDTVPNVGAVGVTNEVLLAIVIDRLRCFQAGNYPCRENAIAITKCEEALHWLGARTRARQQRGVEGKLDA